MKFSSLALLSLLHLASAQFAEVDLTVSDADEAKEARGVVFPAMCFGQFQNVPQLMYTVRPSPNNSDGVAVFSNPPDIIEAGVDPSDGLIYMRMREDIAFPLEQTERQFESAGVVVEFPTNQLEVVTISSDQMVQIQDGFTAVRDLIVHSGATCNAEFTSRIRARMNIDVRDDASLFAEINTSGSNGEAVVTARRSQVEIIGNLRNLDCADNSECVLDGEVTNRGRAIASSTIDANSCDNVEGDCTESNPRVTVNAGRSLTMSGETEICVQPSGLVDPSFILSDGGDPIDDDVDDIPPSEEDDRFQVDDRFQDEPTDSPTEAPTATRDGAMSLTLSTAVLATIASVGLVW